LAELYIRAAFFNPQAWGSRVGWTAAHYRRKELHLPLDDEKNLSDDVREWLDRPL